MLIRFEVPPPQEEIHVWHCKPRGWREHQPSEEPTNVVLLNRGDVKLPSSYFHLYSQTANVSTLVGEDPVCSR